MLFRANKQALLEGLKKAQASYRLAGLTRDGGKVLYDFVDAPDQLVWEYVPTVLPPKKFFFPQREIMIEFDDEGGVEAAPFHIEPFILFGVRPCDLHGIHILDQLFSEDHSDPYYLSRRNSALIIGMDCNHICDEHAFCYLVGANHIETGFDILLRPVDDNNFLVEVSSDKGEKFVNEFIEMQMTSDEDLEKYEQKKSQGFSNFQPLSNLSEIPKLFQKHQDHSIWDQEGDRCLSCGSCVMVCPTCYCFDVKDEWDLDMKHGQRYRQWDGCMADEFAVVAGGENFRSTPVNRLRHRMNRKFNFLMEKLNESVCVGCGRCVRACLVKISPKTVLTAIAGEKEGEHEQ